MRFARTLSLSLKLAYKRGVASIFVPPTPTRSPFCVCVTAEAGVPYTQMESPKSFSLRRPLAPTPAHLYTSYLRVGV